MASIYKETTVEVSADEAWAALRDVGAAHKLFAPVLLDSHLENEIRAVRFADGKVVKERIVDVDEQRHRVAYSAMSGGGMTHHHASMQILGEGPNRCRFVWISDFLPHEVASSIAPLIDLGSQALKDNLERR
jgi:hypothetical protein